MRIDPSGNNNSFSDLIPLARSLARLAMVWPLQQQRKPSSAEGHGQTPAGLQTQPAAKLLHIMTGRRKQMTTQGGENVIKQLETTYQIEVSFV